MAKIPMGDFGQAVAQARPTPTASAGQLDGGLSDAIQRLGNTGMTIAAQQMLQSERELAQADELRGRVMSTTALKGLGNDFRDLADEVVRSIVSREIKPGEAGRHFDKLAQKATKERLEGLTPEMAKLVQASSTDSYGAARNRAIDGAVTQTRREVHAEILKAGEEFERVALVNRPAAVAQYEQLLTTMGQQAGLAPDQLQKDAQSFRERTAFNLGSSLVRGARDDAKELDRVGAALRGSEFVDLSPERLGQLDQQLLSRKQFLENREANRISKAEALTAKRERLAESAVKSISMLIDGGAVPDQITTEKASAQVAGTAFASTLTELLRNASQSASFAQLNPQQQEQAIISMRQKLNVQGSNPALEKRIDNFAHIASESKRQLREDPLMYGVNRRLIEIQPLQFNNLDQLSAQLGSRTEAARTVSARTGIPVSPLLASEASQAADMLTALPLGMKRSAVQQLAKALDPSMVQALGSQVGGKDGVLGSAIFAAANLPPVVSELILRGDDARKAGRIKADDTVARADYQSIAREINKVQWPTTEARNAAVQAAERVYDGLRDKNNGSASWRDAVTHATGGLVEWAGAKVPLPPGFDERQFKRALEKMNPRKLETQAGGAEVTVGGVAMPVDKLAANMGTVRLIPAGSGKYALESGGQMVMTRRGTLLRIGLGD